MVEKVKVGIYHSQRDQYAAVIDDGMAGVDDGMGVDDGLGVDFWMGVDDEPKKAIMGEHMGEHMGINTIYSKPSM